MDARPARRAPRRRSLRTTACFRVGCNRPAITRSRGRHRYCSAECRVADRALVEARNICEAVGSVGNLWAAAVAVSDALVEYQRIASAVERAAMSVGITDEQWRAIKTGHSTSNDREAA